MNAETKAKFDARMQELPNSVRGAIQKTQLSENLQAITISHHLHIDQAEVLEELVMGTVLGYQSFQTLAPSIESGVKVSAESGWFAARPSGTENIYKIYAESFRGEAHLRRIVEEAQAIVDAALA